jgi:alpha-1,3-rhamnosyl/mannosyltransferase
MRRAYAAAFAAARRVGRYAACFEPNHLAIPTGARAAATVHDLSVLDHPEWHPPERVRHWEGALSGALEATAVWIADSRFTRGRMAALLGVAAERVAVVPLAARPLAYPSADALARAKAAGRLPRRYLLHLGTIEPRKNVEVLLEAYAALPAAARDACRLVLAGAPGWGGEGFWRSLVGHRAAGEVLATGYVTDAAAAALLAGAEAVLVPSRYEGFGLPVVEGMAAGAPVVCSTAAALVETAGGAAETVAADDAAGWSAAMRLAVEDAAWRAKLIAAGAERAAAFSWRATARATAAAVESLT